MRYHLLYAIYVHEFVDDLSSLAHVVQRGLS